MPTVTELVSENITNAVTNSQTWGGIIYNVKAYEADGGGSTNDTAAIQAAIDAAEAAGGGIVFFPKGTYNITSAITIPDNVWLCGAGKNSTIINVAAVLTGDAGTLKNSDKTNGNSYIKLSDFSLNINYLTYAHDDFTHGIRFDKCTNIIIEAIETQGCSGTGIVVLDCSDVYISHVTSHDNDGDGIYIAEDCSHYRVVDNYCYDNNTAGIDSYNNTYGTIANNICHGNAGSGITLDHISYISISENNCYDNLRGIGVWGAKYSSICGNTLSANSERGISVSQNTALIDSYALVISNNVIKDNTLDGAYIVADQDNIQFNSNTVYNNGRNGIISEAVKNLVVNSNSFISNSTASSGTYSGIYLSGVTNSVINGNMATNTSASSTQRFGVRATSDDYLVITSNYLKGNTEANGLTYAGSNNAVANNIST